MSDLKAVVLAAGKGTRMQSESAALPKVLREANGKPLLHYVLRALQFIPAEDTILVTGFLSEKVTEAFSDYPSVLQQPQLGTGHAVACAAPLLAGFSGTVLVCYGDMPLLKRETYEALLRTHREAGAACTLLSGTTDRALPYGRVLTDAAGNFLRVVEDRDCTPEQKRVRDLNVGIYCFQNDYLLPALQKLGNDNAQHEYYLTDVPELIRAAGGSVRVHRAELNEQLIGVNTPEQLREVESYLG